MPEALTGLLEACGYSLRGVLIRRSKAKYLEVPCAAARFALLQPELRAAIGSAEKYLAACRIAESRLKSASWSGMTGCTFEAMLAMELQRLALESAKEPAKANPPARPCPH